MTNGGDHSGRIPPQACSEVIFQCLSTIVALSPQELAQPSNQSGLRVLRDTIDSLLKKHTGTPQPQHEARTSENMDSPLQSARTVSTKDDAKDEHFDAETSPPESKVWKSRRKSNQEKEEKRARLEKREEILRNLRNAVSQFKSEKIDDSVITTSSGVSTLEFSPLEKFEIRRQRASFWPRGSQEWARQLLGVELGMDANEKRQCYLEMVKACHPDHNQNLAPDAIQLVNEAWEVLR